MPNSSKKMKKSVKIFGSLMLVSRLISETSGLIGEVLGPTVRPDKITRSGSPIYNVVLFIPPPFVC